jgi:hypothetical protein
VKKTITALAAMAVMALSLLGFGGGTAHAATPVPYPAALRTGHTYALDWSLQSMSSSPWTTPGNSPGNCPINPSAVSLQPGFVQLNADGASNSCTSIQSPHMYPTTPGYVYEAKIYVSNDENWPAMWAYGNNWPNQGEIDAMEIIRRTNYVSYHYAPCNSTATQSAWTTDGIYSQCEQSLTPHAPNFVAHSWIIVDYSFTSTGIDVYYNGQLYVHVPETTTSTTDDPYWLTFSQGPCNDGGNECAQPSDATATGNLGIAYFRAFT